LGLTIAFVISRVVFISAGVRFDMSAASGRSAFWQFLSAPLLQHHLVQSLWYLHSQPPLFNLATGLLLKLPTALQHPVAQFGFLVLGLVLVLATYLTLIDLGAPHWVALITAGLIMLDPAAVLYENWYFYALPTATLLTVGTLCCIRYLRTQRFAWGLGFFGSLSAVVLMNSTFQIEWLAIPFIGILLVDRRRWRTVLAAAAVPLLIVVGWYVKDAVQFGTFTTSSWIGMNVAPSTTLAAPRSLINRLIANGTLTPLAAIPPFGPVSTYEPRFTKTGHTGVPALDQRRRAGGSSNYNNLAYVAVSRQYLHNDIAFIKAEPGRYAVIVSRAVKMSFVPTDQFYVFVVGSHPNRSAIATWSRLYDAGVLWQPSDDPSAGLATELGHAPGFSQVAYGTLAIYALALVGLPLACWHRRRDRPFIAAMGFLWLTTTWLMVVTSLVEIGENNRLRFEVGPLPAIAAVATLSTLLSQRTRVPPPNPGTDAVDHGSDSEAADIALRDASVREQVRQGTWLRLQITPTATPGRSAHRGRAGPRWAGSGAAATRRRAWRCGFRPPNGR
jgi:hypothetical protein